jgi:hypothetical protein
MEVSEAKHCKAAVTAGEGLVNQVLAGGTKTFSLRGVPDLALAEGVHQAVPGDFERVAGTLDAYTTGNYQPEPDSRTKDAREGTPSLLRTKSMYQPGGAMLALGGNWTRTRSENRSRTRSSTRRWSVLT